MTSDYSRAPLMDIMDIYKTGCFIRVDRQKMNKQRYCTKTLDKQNNRKIQYIIGSGDSNTKIGQNIQLNEHIQTLIYSSLSCETIIWPIYSISVLVNTQPSQVNFVIKKDTLCWLVNLY